MVDIKTTSQRSANMARINSKNTRPELRVREYLTSKGIRYRCNVSSLPGKPDIAIKKYKIAIQVNGCFWHSHNKCKYFRIPKSNVRFWTNKLEANLARDIKMKKELLSLQYRIFTIWECQIKANNYEVLDEAISFIVLKTG